MVSGYLGQPTADGACMFTSIIMGIDAELEYTQIHLRRDMLLLLCEDPDYFFPLIKHHIQEGLWPPKETSLILPRKGGCRGTDHRRKKRER